MPLSVLSLLPIPGLAEQVDAALPGTRLTLAGDNAPVELHYDCLLTAAVGAADLAQTLQRHPGIRWIHALGTGMDSFPLGQVGNRLLTCSRGASAIPIAEWVMAMMLGFAKRLPDVWIHSAPAHWHRNVQLTALAGKQLGIVGFGAIGKALARRALAFDMQVAALTRTSRPSMPGVNSAANIVELAAAADHLVLAAPATAATRRLIGRDVLAAMKPTAHIVNIARGSLIDTDALQQALDEERIAMTSLDTVEPEPLPEGHWMYSHPRVRLSPHVSWSDPDALHHLLAPFLDNLALYAQGRPLNGRVDVEAGY
jgi:phosphoglycerate dehydrogenase-like enzyme